MHRSAARIVVESVAPDPRELSAVRVTDGASDTRSSGSSMPHEADVDVGAEATVPFIALGAGAAAGAAVGEIIGAPLGALFFAGASLSTDPTQKPLLYGLAVALWVCPVVGLSVLGAVIADWATGNESAGNAIIPATAGGITAVLVAPATVVAIVL